MNKNLTATYKREQLTIKELMQFMKLEGLSAKELAEILGVTVQAVTLWLKGERDISMTITRLIRVFQKYPKLIREFGR